MLSFGIQYKCQICTGWGFARVRLNPEKFKLYLGITRLEIFANKRNKKRSSRNTDPIAKKHITSEIEKTPADFTSYPVRWPDIRGYRFPVNSIMLLPFFSSFSSESTQVLIFPTSSSGIYCCINESRFLVWQAAWKNKSPAVIWPCRFPLSFDAFRSSGGGVISLT